MCSTNAPVSHGSFLPIIEWYARYAFKLLTHIQRTSIRTIEPTAAAQDDYFVWSHQLLKRTTMSQPCRSWFKNGLDHGPAVAVYAGSRAHFYEALKEPRLEDFKVDYIGLNRFAYFGHGFSEADLDDGANAVWYLDLLRSEAAAGQDVYDINPLQPKRTPIDPELVIPKGSKVREAGKQATKL